MTNELQHLSLTWGISKGRDTYGYNILTLRDEHGHKYRTMGGGYDMTGTVLGDWLESNYQDRLMKIRSRAHSTWMKSRRFKYNKKQNALYGMRYSKTTNGVVLDGACGESCMVAIAKAIGLSIKYTTAGRRNTHTGYIIEDTRKKGWRAVA